MDKTTCVESYNKAASYFNSRMQQKLATLRTSLGMKIAYVDAYGIVEDAVNHPMKYGQYIKQWIICANFHQKKHVWLQLEQITWKNKWCEAFQKDGCDIKNKSDILKLNHLISQVKISYVILSHYLIKVENIKIFNLFL